MKGLIRNAGETVREDSGIEGIDWTTGAPLTNPSWAGGPYAMAEDCPADAEPGDFDIREEQVQTGEEDEDGSPITVLRRIAELNADRYAARRAAEAQEEAPTPEPEPEAPQEAPEGAQEPEDVVIIDGVEYRRAGA